MQRTSHKVLAFGGVLMWGGFLLAIDFVPHSYGHEQWLDACAVGAFAGVALIVLSIILDWRDS